MKLYFFKLKKYIKFKTFKKTSFSCYFFHLIEEKKQHLNQKIV